MRKTSQDGGDSTSITSGVDIEFKKSILKTKKSSLKRKPPSSEVDDTVNEPLLTKDKEKSVPIQSAKSFFKAKTEIINEKSDKGKLLNDAKIPNTSSPILIKANAIITKEQILPKSTGNAPLHNYMNTNVFNTHDSTTANVSTKSQILVEIDGTKSSGYSPTPLIFTTAKIHTDGKSKHMEPVQMTPVPILSTVEISLSKKGNVTTNEKKISNGSTVLNTIYSNAATIDKKKDEKPNTLQLSNIVTTTEKNTVVNPTTTTSAAAPGISVTSISLVSNLTSTSTSTKPDNKMTDKKDANPSIAKMSTTETKKSELDNTLKDLVKTTQSSLSQAKTLEQANTSTQSNNQNAKLVSEKSNTVKGNTVSQSNESQLKGQNLNPVGKTDLDSEKINSIKTNSGNKPQQSQKPIEEITKSSKIEHKTDIPATKPDTSKTNAKIVSSSIKQPSVSAQTKTPSSNVSKESDKSRKPSANEVKTSVPSKVTANPSSAVNVPTPAKSTNNSANSKTVNKSSNIPESNTKTSANKSVTTTASAISNPSQSSISKSTTAAVTTMSTKSSTNTNNTLPIKTTPASTNSDTAPSKSTVKTISSKEATITKPSVSKLPTANTNNNPETKTPISKADTSSKSAATKTQQINSSKTPSTSSANGIAKIADKKPIGKSNENAKEGKTPKA